VRTVAVQSPTVGDPGPAAASSTRTAVGLLTRPRVDAGPKDSSTCGVFTSIFSERTLAFVTSESPDSVRSCGAPADSQLDARGSSLASKMLISRLTAGDAAGGAVPEPPGEFPFPTCSCSCSCSSSEAVYLIRENRHLTTVQSHERRESHRYKREPQRPSSHSHKESVAERLREVQRGTAREADRETETVAAILPLCGRVAAARTSCHAWIRCCWSSRACTAPRLPSYRHCSL
jgi:hypothetical protein